MRYLHLFETIYRKPWYITSAGYATVRAVFESHCARQGMPLMGSTESSEDLLKRFDRGDMRLSDLVNARPKMTIGTDGIATIDILGPVARGMSNLERACGATGFEELATELQAAFSSARGILLRGNTPGGTVNGTPEIAAMIAESPIPVVAHTADMIASAGYYLAAGARAIIATPSAAVGSIGVLYAWMDYKEQLKMLGLAGAPITNKEGDLKGLGFTGELTPVQREYLEEEAQTLFDRFKGHVLQYREVPDAAMRGQVLQGPEALAANLIDELGDEAHARAVLRAMIGR
jgi:signal peptide peptidase SppA